MKKYYDPESFDMECFFMKVKKGELKNGSRNSRRGISRNQTERKHA